MRARAVIRLGLVLVCGLLLASLGLSEFDVHPKDTPVAAALEDHAHFGEEPETVGHCHPGIDCAPPVIFMPTRLPEANSARFKVPYLARISFGSGWRLTADPPPPRPIV
jgi:hypothetical protein